MTSLYPLYDALVAVNVPSDKARVVVDAMERDMLAQLATKSDLQALGRELRAELALVRQESKSDIALLRSEITGEVVRSRNSADAGFVSLHKDMDAGLAAQRKDMDVGFGLLRADMDSQRKDLIIWLGSLQIIGMGLLFTALRLL